MTNRLYEQKINKNTGELMVIVEYNSAIKTTVCFSDGTISENVTYNKFKNGGLRKPKNLIGEQITNTLGHKMTITEHKTMEDISVQFECGLVIKNRRYIEFINGKIRKPLFANIGVDRIGEKIFNSWHKMEMEIIEYFSSSDITVKFADGTITKNMSYYGFVNGSITKALPIIKVGDSKLNRKGQLMTITKVDGRFIDLIFEDGTIRTKVERFKFISGKVRKYTDIVVGSINKNGKGELMTVIKIMSYSNITVEFEDGTIIHNKSIEQFKNGWITKLNKIEERFGAKKLNNDGEEMTIIDCVTASNVTIQFSDGTISYNRYFDDFVKGLISNPNTKQEKNSRPEKEITEFIKEITGEYIEVENKTILSPKHLDIYVPSFNIAIEYNGLYWHSNKFRENNYHLQKTLSCLEKGIKLVQIFEDEWLTNKEIVKSRIRNFLGKIEHKIHARKCVTKEIDYKTARNFLNETHLQGTKTGLHFLGLFFMDELVSVMVFSSLSKMHGLENKEGYYELSRFSNKLNTNVIGGASKLLKYFEVNFNPKEIISYADRRWSEGGLYKTLGFTKTKISKPNYFYIANNNNKQRLSKFIWRDIKQKYPNRKESEVMLELGYLKIYDCGKIRFTKNYTNSELIEFSGDYKISAESGGMKRVNVIIDDKLYRTTQQQKRLVDENMTTEEKINIIKDTPNYREIEKFNL